MGSSVLLEAIMGTPRVSRAREPMATGCPEGVPATSNEAEIGPDSQDLPPERRTTMAEGVELLTMALRSQGDLVCSLICMSAGTMAFSGWRFNPDIVTEAWFFVMLSVCTVMAPMKGPIRLANTTSPLQVRYWVATKVPLPFRPHSPWRSLIVNPSGEHSCIMNLGLRLESRTWVEVGIW